MRGLIFRAAIVCMIVVAVFAARIEWEQTRPAEAQLPDGPDVDCPEISQAEAQAILDADPSDPNRLDADDDGLACEDGGGSGGTQYSDDSDNNEYATDDQYDGGGTLMNAGGPGSGPAPLVPGGGCPAGYAERYEGPAPASRAG